MASLSQGRTAAAQCGLFTHKSVPVIFVPPCIWLTPKLRANILDYIRGEATVLGYQTVTGNCNLLVPLHCFDPVVCTFLYYTSSFIENYWVEY